MKKLKKLATGLLAFVLALSALTPGMTALAADGQQSDGTLDLSGNPDASFGDGWSWTGGAAKTLTLSGADIRSQDSDGNTYGVKLPGGSTIVLMTGTANVIRAGETAGGGISHSFGIYVNGALSIEGAGALYAVGGAAEYSAGISVGELTVNGGTVTAIGGSAARSHGLSVEVLTANGGTVTAEGGAASNISYGIASDMLSINGGTATFNGGMAGNASYGISTGSFIVDNTGEDPGVAPLVIASGGIAGTTSHAVNTAANVAPLTGAAADSSFCVYGASSGFTVLDGSYATAGDLAAAAGSAASYSGGVLTLGNIIVNSTANTNDAALNLSHSDKITLQGIAVIHSADTEEGDDTLGIRCLGPMTIDGPGALRVSSGMAGGAASGIYAEGTLTIGGCTVAASGRTSAMGYTFGIMAYKLVSNGGSVTGIAASTERYSHGIYLMATDLVVTGGEVTGISGSATDSSYGIIGSNGSVSITNGMVTGISGAAKESYGVVSFGLVIANSAITASSGSAETTSAGIISLETLTVSGADTVINAKSGTSVVSRAIQADNYYNDGTPIIISSPLAVVSPAGGGVSTAVAGILYEDGSFARFIATTEGGTTAATAVTIKTPPPLEIVIQPSDKTATALGDASFSVTAIGCFSWQWQVSADGGVIWNDVTDDGMYAGAQTAKLSIIGADYGMNGWYYRVIVGSASDSETSDAAVLTVNETDTVAPVLSSGSVNRTGDTAATIGFTTSEEGTAYYTVVNSGASAPSKEAVSAGTSLGSVSGTVSGKAVALTAGAKDIYVVVMDAAGYISDPLKIEAMGYVTGITFTAAQTGGAAGTADSTGIVLTFSEAVTGLTADDITITPGSGSAAKGALSGSGDTWTVELTSVATEGDVTVSVENFGTFHVTTASQTAAVYKAIVPVGMAPAIATNSIASGTVMMAYSQTLMATGDTPITWSIDNGSLPDGLMLLSDGVISGIPLMTGTFNFTVKATNITGSDTKALSIAISAAPPSGTAPTITTSTLDGGTVGTAYSDTLSASGDTPITWSIESGDLPDGLSLSGNIISGTPEAEGVFNFTVKAENSTGIDTKALSIEISEASTDKILISVTTPAAITGVANGTAKTASALGLPSTATLVTSSGNAQANVVWDVAGSSYNPSSGSSQTFTVNGTVTLPAGITNPDSVSLNTSINVTVKAYSSGGGSSGGGISSGGSRITILPEKKPDQPLVISAELTPTVDKNGLASVSVPDQIITDAIKKAREEAKKQGKTANSIGVSLNFKMHESASELNLTLSQGALQSLVNAGVTSLELDGAPISLRLDLEALKEIQKQSAGNVTITIKPVKNLSAAAKKLIGARPVYDVTVSYVKDGNTVSITSFGKGSVILSFPYTPGKNEAVGWLFGVYVDDKGNATRMLGSAYDANSRSVIFSRNHFSIYGVGYMAPVEKYADMATHWAKESINYVLGRGLFSGTTNTNFSPDTVMNRGMLVTVLGRMAGADVSAYRTSSFSDVAGKYYLSYVEWAYKKGVASGIGGGKFAPERAVTREEIALILQNYAKVTGYTIPATREAINFADNSSIASTYANAIRVVQQAGIIAGDSGNKFRPKAGATRAEVAAMLHRYIKLTIDPATAQGWALNDAGQYLYYKDGKPLTGWQIIDDVKYYFSSTGALQTGWIKDESGNWHFYSGNTMLAGWWNTGSGDVKKTYYFTKEGMVAGKWLQINGKWYYFYADGFLARNTTIDGYKVDENGLRGSK